MEYNKFDHSGTVRTNAESIPRDVASKQYVMHPQTLPAQQYAQQQQATNAQQYIPQQATNAQQYIPQQATNAQQYIPQQATNAQQYIPQQATNTQQYIPQQQDRNAYAYRTQPQGYADRPYQPPVPNQNIYRGVSGTANAFPPFQFIKSAKEIEKDNIRAASNRGGALTISITVTMFFVALIIGIIAFFTGTFSLDFDSSDPYMGFTPIGFYTYEALASLLSIFIPSLIIMNISKKSEKLRVDDFLPFKPIEGRKLAAVVFAGMGVCMFAQILSSILSYNFTLLGFDVEEAIDITFGTSAMDIILNSIGTAVIPALVEEFAYRGVVLGALKKYDTNLAIVGSAFLFGMVHGNLAQIPFAFIVGLVLAYVRVKTDSMIPNILIHFGNNFYAVIVTSIGEKVPDSVSTIIDIAVVVVFILVGIMCTYFIVKNDKNFFKIEQQKTELTFTEKAKTFFSSGTVIASCIILALESAALIKLL